MRKKKIFAKKLQNKAQNEIFLHFFYLSAKIASPWSLYGIKIARIEQIKIAHMSTFNGTQNVTTTKSRFLSSLYMPTRSLLNSVPDSKLYMYVHMQKLRRAI
jgi:hypothetical protein